MTAASFVRSPLPRILAGIVLLAPLVRAEAPWKFVVIPDAMNNDVALDDTDWYGDGLDGTFDDGTYAAWSFTLNAIAAESPDFVLVPGDLVQGRWSLDAFTDAQIANKIATDPANFGHLAGLSGTEARKQHVRWMADRFYPDWNRMWTDHGITKVYTIPGDHEFGDNDWGKSYDVDLVPVYREKYEQYRPAPAGAASYPGFGGRTFSLTHKNLTLVGVDVFDRNEGGNVSLGVGAPHLAFVRQALAASTPAHKIAMAHTPIIPGSLKRSSSGIELPGGASSDLWQTFAAENVDMFFAGEVHDISMQQKDAILQMVCGTQPSNVPEFNYLVVTVHDDRLELELKLLNTTLEGPRSNANDPYGVDPYLLRKVKLTRAQFETGFQTVGTMVIDKPGDERAFTGKTGIFASARYTNLDLDPAPTDGLLVHYKFDGDLSDSAGKRDGTLLNAQSGLGTSGARLGSGYLAIDPTGDGNLANVGFQSGGPDLDLGSGARTVAFFVRAAASLAPSTQATLFSLGSGTGTNTGQRFDLTFPLSSAPINDLRIEVNGNGAGGGDIDPIRTNFADGNWHHVAVTSDASGSLGGVELFVDGTLIGTAGAGSSPLINTAASRITIGDSFAASIPNPLRGLKGDIDDFRIYDTVLTPAQIQSLANPVAETFADWIGGYELGEFDGPDDDPDGDGIQNGVENFFGTHPGEFSEGIIAGETDGNTFAFTHPRNATPAADLRAAYRWSTNLTDWYAGDNLDGPGGLTVAIVPGSAGLPVTTVTATSSQAVPGLFFKVEVTLNTEPSDLD
jgi:hypothetical protein